MSDSLQFSPETKKTFGHWEIVSRIRETVSQGFVYATILLLFLAFGTPLAGADTQQWRFSGVDRVIAVGDVHGAYDALVPLLQETGLLSSDLEWAGGTTWLVMLGDLVDRGPRSRDVLDLVMHLQRTAPRAGGRVLVVLGNHDVMNMLGQLLFVSEQGFAAFAANEKAATRNRIFKKRLKRSEHDHDPAVARREFDRSSPPGTFALRKAFSRDGVYGRWLLDQHILVVIDDTVYVHGGLAPRLTEYRPDEINRLAIDELRAIMKAQKALVGANVFGAETDYDEQQRPAELYLEQWAESRRPRVRRRLAAARTVSEMSTALAVSGDGPLWYRGTYLHPQYKEDGRASQVLAHLGVDRVVMGHTENETGRVQVRLDGRAVMIDTGMLASEYSGQASAVIIADGRISAFYPGEEYVALPDPSPRPVIDTHIREALEEALATANVLSTEMVEATQSRRVLLLHEKWPLKATFETADQSYKNEVAAYLVDRMLGFGLVPPTVIRRIGDEVGSLQLWSEDWVIEADSIDQEGDSHFREKNAEIRIFDCLIDNVDRDPSSILWSIDQNTPRLIDHSLAFGARVGTESCPSMTGLDETTARRLRSLNTEHLLGELHELLSEAQIEALLARRDLMLR